MPRSKKPSFHDQHHKKVKANLDRVEQIIAELRAIKESDNKKDPASIERLYGEYKKLHANLACQNPQALSNLTLSGGDAIEFGRKETINQHQIRAKKAEQLNNDAKFETANEKKGLDLFVADQKGEKPITCLQTFIKQMTTLDLQNNTEIGRHQKQVYQELIRSVEAKIREAQKVQRETKKVTIKKTVKLTLKNVTRQELNRLSATNSQTNTIDLRKALTRFQEAAATSLNEADKKIIREAQRELAILKLRKKQETTEKIPSPRTVYTEGSSTERHDSFDKFLSDDYLSVELKADVPVLFYPKTWRALGITAATTGSLIATPALFVITLAAANWITQGLSVTTQFTTDALKLFLGFNTSDPLITISGIVFVVAAAAIAWGAVTIYRSKQRQHPVDALRKQLSDQRIRTQRLQQENDLLRDKLNTETKV